MTEEQGVRRRLGNGEIPQGVEEDGQNGDVRDRLTIQRQISVQIIRDKAMKIKGEMMENFDGQLQELLNGFVHDIDVLKHSRPGGVWSASASAASDSHRTRRKGELPEKEFVPRNSVLTELLEISHIRTIYHIFVAILIVFSLNTVLYDLMVQGRLVLDFDIMVWAFAKFPIVLWNWLWMMGATTLIVFPLFYFWSNTRRPGPAYLLDWIMLGCYVCYQVAFLVLPIQSINENALAPASSVVICCEQVRMLMKSHAFIRHNIPRAMGLRKKHDEHDDLDASEGPCPGFSNYLYFLFAPTLVYSDHYPRTPTIRWQYVFSNFAQVLASMFYTYYIFERFCVPVFRDFNQEYVTPQKLLLNVFSCVLPGTLVLFLGFFAILHSWLNAFAEMLRFADRLFYKDWWNSSSFSAYYRTWNIVVHDWLYSYVYRDCLQLLGMSSKPVAMASVFLLSAIFHEYILTVVFGFFYPVLFTLFAGAGFAFIFLPSKSNRSGNVFMWVALFLGNGILMCLYSMEWFARRRCPYSNDDPLLDKLIPRSWTCDLPPSTQ